VVAVTLAVVVLTTIVFDVFELEESDEDCIVVLSDGVVV
jgi:hypothetical protein